MTITEAKAVMQAYRDRENGIDFAIKIIDMINEKPGQQDKQGKKEKPRQQQKEEKAPRVCPKCGNPIKGRGNKKICDDCRNAPKSVEDDIKQTAKELQDLAR